MIVIQTFRPEHRDGVIDVILPIQQKEFGVAVTLEQQPDLLDVPGFYQHGAGNFWVAISDDRVVGTIALLDIGDGRAALRKMFVKQEYRGAQSGVAAKLLEVLLKWCNERELAEVYLGTTAQFLAAHRFYEKHGFTEIAMQQLPRSFPIMSVDTKFYLRTLGVARNQVATR